MRLPAEQTCESAALPRMRAILTAEHREIDMSDSESDSSDYVTVNEEQSSDDTMDEDAESEEPR
jgi:hypothetical protein